MTLLKEGMRGEAAAALKKRLSELGYEVTPGDGYDRTTEWAAVWFRARNGMEPAEGADDAFLEALYSGDAVRGVDPEGVREYSMKDPLWAEYPYDAANTPEIERMKNSACGPTCLAMVLSTLLRRAVLPPVLADWSNAHGFRDPDGIHGTDDSFFAACAARYGVASRRLDGYAVDAYEEAAAALAAGKAVIANVVPGSPYTKCGHYLILKSMNEGMEICDPNPLNWNLPVYTRREWEENRWCKAFLILEKTEEM